MRRGFANIPNPLIGRATTSAAVPAAFSSSSGGRGRGEATPFRFTVDTSSRTEPDNSKDESPSPLGHGHGRGRGKPLQSPPVFPPLSSFANNDNGPAGVGRGRGGGFIAPRTTPPLESQLPQQRSPVDRRPQKPFPFVENDAGENSADSRPPLRHEKILPSEIINVLTAAGRGKPIEPEAACVERPKSENRHARSRQPTKPSMGAGAGTAAGTKISEQLTRKEKVKKAVGILSKEDDESMKDGGGIRSGRGGLRARGGRGRGRGRGYSARGRGQGRGRERGEVENEDSDNDEVGGLYEGDPADGEKLAEKLGPVVMNELVEGFEEMSSRVLPSPEDDAYIDALHTNLLIECEPEYMMEEFGTNPDIDEQPPISLPDALEKMKPFLMAYEGIQSQEEWEAVIEETMKTVPLMKEIVDHYSGPDRVTSKQQQEELERVAKTLPASAPASVKRFTERAVLSLQSNPGWGFDKKCQFMDKLIMEVSRQ